MSRGDLVGALGASIHDALLGPFENDAEFVWPGLIGDKYPVKVGERQGVSWVHAQAFDKVGWFRDRDWANEFVSTNCGSVHGLSCTKGWKKCPSQQ